MAAAAVKWLMAVMAVILIVSNSGRTRASRTSFSKMEQSVLQGTDLSGMQKGDSQMVRRLYGLDPSRFEGVLLYYPKTNMDAEEIFLLKMKDTSDQDRVRAAIQARLSVQKKSFEGYGASQTAMLENSRMEIHGNYALFVSAKDPDSILEKFRKAY